MNVPLKYYACVPTRSVKEQARDHVREEKKEVDRKYTALCEFLADPGIFDKVDSVESGLLYEQRNALKHYREAMTARIAHWENE